MALVRVRYKGLSDVRVISVKDAESVGVKLSQDLVWDQQGEAAGAVIPGVKRPKFPNAAKGIVIDVQSDDLMKMLKDEATFTVSEVKDDGNDGEEIITGEVLDDTGSTVVASATGQRSSAGEPNADADPVPSGTKAGGTTPTGTTGTTGTRGRGRSTGSTT